jgi:signal transduction histidine kinase
MGSRGRSIRLRIYFLVAIPLLTMLGMFGYVAYTSVTTWLNLDRGPSLIDATSVPLANFVNLLQAERRAAVVYLSQPDAANLASYRGAIATTKTGAAKLAVALSSPGTKGSSTPDETAAIVAMTAQINDMTRLRNSVTGKQLAPLTALQDYTNVIAGQGAVLQAEAHSIMDAGPALQGLGLISAVSTQEDMSEQDAVLASALAGGSLTAADRVAFSQAAGRQQSDTMTYQAMLTPAELTTYNATLSQLAPKTVQDNLSTIQQAVPAGVPLNEMKAQGLNPQVWHTLTGTWLHASIQAGTDTASAVLAANQQPARDARRRVWIIGAAGAAGLILTLLVSLLLSRSINRRLGALRRSALTLANEQLPALVSRLRRGESVDVAATAPPPRGGSDEIGQVGEAIDTVRQTAIRAAIEEARARQGVNDMFRNLARRNQSLLQRQLQVLDGMERRATDPDLLEDLFKMDHLTTRMRRHAEGLIILSGAAPGRSWSAPVKLVDVLRGAVAEVEDYARVTVSTQTRGALAGSAVTDVIHLLAELIENATSLSPPFTQVRVGGEAVANGFAIEIEDRGLGMRPERLAELNERLANPPDINPANTEQLGLFVVGKLARRHGISVVLRPSPYGGTTAVALLPPSLMMQEGQAAIAAAAPPRTAYPGSRGHGARPDDGSGAVSLPVTPGAGNNWPGRRGTDGWPVAPAAGQGTGDVPVVTGVPLGKPGGSPTTAFDVFAPVTRDHQGAADQGNNDQGDSRYDSGTGDGAHEHNGLPRRVRQASLAPQLRASAAAAGSDRPGVAQANPASLTEMRNTLSAMQRGWQQGRSESQRDAERDGER